MSKFKKSLLFSVGFLLIATIPLQVVVAQEQVQPTRGQEQINSEDQSTRAERLETYRARRNVTLTQASEARIKNRCISAQERIGSINEKVAAALERRTVAYTNIVDRLKRLTEKLELANIDTSSLTIVIADIENESQAILTKLREHQTAIEDTVSVNCTDNPLDFKAALEEAKIARAELKTEVLEFKKLINDNLKKELSFIREQLQSATEESDVNEVNEE